MFRRYALQSVIALAAVAALTACASHAPAPQPLTATLSQTPAVKTFNQLVTEAGLASTLQAPGPYTVFAPTDAAFQALPAKTLAELKADPAKLKNVLSYHIVPKQLMANDIKPGNVKTLQGAEVALGRAGTFVTVEEAMAETTDIRASNGVVHVIDRVLIPPHKK